jgi:hypothetical protein
MALTQDQLSTMTKDQVNNLSLSDVPDGYDIIWPQGSPSAKLVKLGTFARDDDEEFLAAENETAPLPPVELKEEPAPISSKKETIDGDKYKKLTPAQRFSSLQGLLFLRFFRFDPKTKKVTTRLRRIVYFPTRAIKEGWYVGTVVTERQNHGEMDVMELDKIPYSLWDANCIKGVHIKFNKTEQALEIYPAMKKERLAEEEQVLIHKVSLPAPKEIRSTATIQEILAAKEEELQNSKKPKGGA